MNTSSDHLAPEPEALKLVQKQIAELYQIMPLTFRNDILTVAAPYVEQQRRDTPDGEILDLERVTEDLRNLLTIQQVIIVRTTRAAVEQAMTKHYAVQREEVIFLSPFVFERDGGSQSNNPAVRLIQKGIAELYGILPLTFDGDILTIAVPPTEQWKKHGPAIIEDIKALLGIHAIETQEWPETKIREGISREYR